MEQIPCVEHHLYVGGLNAKNVIVEGGKKRPSCSSKKRPIERRVVWLKSVEKEKYGGQEGRHLVSHLAT